ncbi:hypothetical protein [Miltoncostaea oceani]|uniref:hypothetical protein n=1 Tax=Miltoncostaea oceani TaxID=2843216 RepID=UPI001C3DC906|nr:hypothetical protein [Miltoncostaea oceani]
MSSRSPLADRRAAGREAEHRPGFLVVRVEDDGTYVGGLMVTDASGLPVDFRYTDPITPTRLQRALYGGVLDRYLRTEVVLRTLIEALDAPPSLLVVDDPDLLDEPIALCPVALVARSGVDPLGAAGARSAQGSGSFLLQAAEGGHPLRVTLPEGSPDEAAVAEALVALGRRMDPLEPAERVRDALAVIVAGEDPT